MLQRRMDGEADIIDEIALTFGVSRGEAEKTADNFGEMMLNIGSRAIAWGYLEAVFL